MTPLPEARHPGAEGPRMPFLAADGHRVLRALIRRRVRRDQLRLSGH